MNCEDQNIKQPDNSNQGNTQKENIPLPLGIPENSYLALMSFLILLPCIGWIIPLILWIMGKDLSQQINRQGKYIINWFISWIVYGAIIGTALTVSVLQALSESFISPNPIPEGDNIFPFFLIYIFGDIIGNFLLGSGGIFLFLSVVAGIIVFVTPIIGGIKGLNGQAWKYPLSIPFLK